MCLFEGDFSMLDLIQVFYQIDASCGYKLSKGRFLKEKRQWAREVIGMHLNQVCVVCSRLLSRQPLCMRT